MKKLIRFLSILLAVIATREVTAQEIILPSIFDGVVIRHDQVKAIPSKDEGGSLVALAVKPLADVSPFMFFDEALWSSHVSVKHFIENPNPDPKVQYASLFCALNSTVKGACASKDLIGVDTGTIWLIPVATVRKEYVSSAVANLIREQAQSVGPSAETTELVVNTDNKPTRVIDSQPVGRGPEPIPEMPATPTQTQPVPVPVVEDTRPTVPIVWDDSPPPPPLPIPRVASDRR